jgi:hypothetical protein
MDRRGLLRALASCGAGLLLCRGSRASVSRALRLEELVARSEHVLLGEPLAADCMWEQIGSRKHIVTYTRLRVVELFAGADPRQDELMVRTLGGRVGELGELVHGEANLQIGERSVLFVTHANAPLAVTGMAQGHYPLWRDAGRERLQRSPEAVELLNEAGGAVQRLHGLELGQARQLLRAR